MGGINTSAVECSAFADSDAINGAMKDYLVNGLIPEGEIMIYYGWWAFGQYVWNLNTQSFINTMQAIIDCGISEGVDSDFGQDFVDTKWTPFREAMQVEFDLMDLWWHPALVIATMLPFPPFFGAFTGIANLAWLVANVLLGLDRQALAMGWYAQLLGEGPEEEEEE